MIEHASAARSQRFAAPEKTNGMFTTAFLDLPHLASAHGCVQLPGSKSISNRVLLLAALSHGTTVLHDLLDSDDTRVMLDALHALGCTITPGEVTPGQPLHITGLAVRCRPMPQPRCF